MKEKNDYLICENILICEAIKILEKNLYKILIVIDSNGKLIGTISDGDVRRYLIRDGDLNKTCIAIANINCIFSENINDFEKINIARKNLVKLIPIVNNEKIVVDILEISKLPNVINNTIVIMAGGLGKRLRPMTNTIPKPLLKVGNKPIIRRITDKFSNEGFHQFIISLGYLSEKFLDYYSNHDKSISPKFIFEKKPLGTAGPLSSLLDIDDISYPIVVTNGDVIFDDNIFSVLDYFERSSIDGLMLCREEFCSVPYGVVESDNKNNFITIKEKPKYKYLVNGGIYILTKKIIELIKQEEIIDMPDLFIRAKLKKYLIKTHTLKDYWIDVGRVANLEEANQKFN